MQNKTGHRLDIIDRSKAQSLQKTYEPSKTTQTTSTRIFEVPAFMFSRKEDGK
jgi:hypothetical protein